MPHAHRMKSPPLALGGRTPSLFLALLLLVHSSAVVRTAAFVAPPPAMASSSARRGASLSSSPSSSSLASPPAMGTATRLRKGGGSAAVIVRLDARPQSRSWQVQGNILGRRTINDFEPTLPPRWESSLEAAISNSDTSLYLKLWYSFYIRVEYQRLHENNLARRAQLMCLEDWEARFYTYYFSSLH